jgi:anti-sigma regulatory factor (Ser/Thr protein kinase)
MFMALHDPEAGHWRCMNCGHPNPIVVRGGQLADPALLSDGGGIPIGIPFGSERPYSTADETVLPDEGDTFLMLYTDGLIEARHAQTRKDCGSRLAEVYQQVIGQATLPNKAAAVLDALAAEGYLLEEDDCTAISIHMLESRKIVVDREVVRDMHAVFELAREAEEGLVRLDIGNDTAARVRLLMMELGANLVEHGGLEQDDSFWVQLRVDGGVCQLVIVDEGAEWDLDEALAEQRDVDHMGERGRGLAITHSITDRIERFRVNTENITYCTIVDEPGASHE